MRIYAVADIHGHPDRIRVIKENTIKLKPDVLIIAGDITHFTHPVPTIARLNDMPVPVLAIRGNTDLKRVERIIGKYSNITSLHLKKIAIDNVCFVGVSGTVPVPFSSRIGFREGPVLDKIMPLLKRDSVLVTHPPPWGTLDEVLGRFHAGCRSLRRIVSRIQPRLLICGHIHERPGTDFIGETLVINCAMARTGAGAVIDLNVDQDPKVEMLGYPH
jgi:Icc-related predicted phosphoesterase